MTLIKDVHYTKQGFEYSMAQTESSNACSTKQINLTIQGQGSNQDIVLLTQPPH